jgi:hypothetical protein
VTRPLNVSAPPLVTRTLMMVCYVPNICSWQEPFHSRGHAWSVLMARVALEIPTFLPQLDGTLEERAPKVAEYVKARVKERNQCIDGAFPEALLLAVLYLSSHGQDPASAILLPWCIRL